MAPRPDGQRKNVHMFKSCFMDRLPIPRRWNQELSCCHILKSWNAFHAIRYGTEYSRFTDYENDCSNYWENRVSRREIAIFPRNTEGMIVCRSLLRVFVNKNLHGDSVRLSSTVRVRRIAFFTLRLVEKKIFSSKSMIHLINQIEDLGE